MHSSFRPSPAMIVALIALFVALGGSAAALSGSNTVFTDDIANDTQPAAGGNPAGGLVAADLRAGSVGSSEVANNSLTGADVNESTLQGVNAATVDGANVCHGLVEQTTSNGDPVAEVQEICAVGPLSISATCDSSLSGSTTGAFIIDTTANDSFFRIADGPFEDPDWDAADLQGFVQVAGTDAAGSLVRRSFMAGAPDGSQLAGELGVRARNSGGSNGACDFVLGVIG